MKELIKSSIIHPRDGVVGLKLNRADARRILLGENESSIHEFVDAIEENFLNVYDKTPLSNYHAQIIDNNFAAHRNIRITPSLSMLIKDTLERAYKSKKREEQPKLAMWLYGGAPMPFLPDFEMYAGPLYANAYRREAFDRERLEELISHLEKSILLRRHYQRKIDSGTLTSTEEQIAKENIVKIDSTMIGGHIMRIRANF